MKKRILLLPLLASIILLCSCRSTIKLEQANLSGSIKDAYTSNDPIKSTGLDKVLVIPINFSQSFNSEMLENIEKAFYGSSQDTGYYSLKEYINISSYNKLDLDITINDSLNSNVSDLIKYSDIINDLKDDINNISNIEDFDTDSNNYIDSIYFIYLSDSNNYSFTDRFKNNFTVFADISLEKNVKIGNVSFVDYKTIEKEYESYYDTTNLLVDSHEIIHQFGYVLGLTDSYDFLPNEGESGGEYNTTMMSGICGDFSAYDKMLLNWTDNYIISGSEIFTTTLNPFVDEGKIILISDHEINSIFDEFLILELYSNKTLNKDNRIKSKKADEEFYVIRPTHINGELKTNSNGKVLKNDTEYNKTAFRYDNSESTYQRSKVVLIKDYVSGDFTYDYLFQKNGSFFLEFRRTLKLKSISFALYSITDGVATLKITL